MNIKPLDSRILVAPERTQDVKTEGGLFVPQTAVQTVQKGTVVATGDGKLVASGAGIETVPPTVKVGDVVFYRSGSGLELDECILLEDFEILAKVDQ